MVNCLKNYSGSGKHIILNSKKIWLNSGRAKAPSEKKLKKIFRFLVTRDTELDGGVVLGECPFSVLILYTHLKGDLNTEMSKKIVYEDLVSDTIIFYFTRHASNSFR
ncbi:hypothetical protein BpHYR1_054580 [Brachionus plicatilis]|uniref:Uncharacterized protein n=1 Tax=Brachionus plicatilis TaxID=10195 RepID=A0A3M7PJV8_BRAPC|nr:hypothetical protein BpHYR1_054580 [Brachionus plicatilis]